MESYLESYVVDMYTISPVFIGSGRMINKKEALFDMKKNEVSIINGNKMFHFVSENDLEKLYEEYIVNPASTLQDFFNDANISSNQYSSWIERRVPLRDIVSDKRNSRNGRYFDNRKDSPDRRGIACFVRDGSGKIYVPGSSLKGMLTTAIMASKLIDDTKLSDDITDRSAKVLINRELELNKRKWDGEFNKIEKDAEVRLFHKEFFDKPKNGKAYDIRSKVDHMLRGLRISDSLPIEDKKLCICQKVDLKPNGDESKLPLYRECLAPNTLIRFSVSIDKTYCDLTMDQILEELERFYGRYQTHFVSKFRNAPKIVHNKEVCYLGGGVGFASKTLLSSLKKEHGIDLSSKILKAKFPRHRHEKDRGLGVSPRCLKCTVYGGRIYQMGACFIKNVKKDD